MHLSERWIASNYSDDRQIVMVIILLYFDMLMEERLRLFHLCHGRNYFPVCRINPNSGINTYEMVNIFFLYLSWYS